MIIASVFFPSFLTHAAEPGFNELDIKRTDAARATRVRGGQGNGAEAKVSSASEEHIGAWVWRPNLGWHCDSTAGPQLSGVPSPWARCSCLSWLGVQQLWWGLTGLQLLSMSVWLSVEGDAELCCRAAGAKHDGEMVRRDEMQPSRNV